MARKRKERNGHNDASTAAATTTPTRATRSATKAINRATRRATSRGDATLQRPVDNPEPRKRRKAEATKRATASTSAVASTSSSDAPRTIIIEHCRQSSSFKKRATQVKNGLEKAVAGIKVLVNPEKPRKGCFEIREEGGEVFLSLLDMERPFEPMKELDMDKVISDIVEKIK